MRAGLCGYPGSGKSTVFAALAPVARADRDLSLGNIKVPDERVDFLASVFRPKKTTHAEVTFVDVGTGQGPAGGRAGGAFPPDVVQAMRNVDLLVHVVRGFDDPAAATPADPDRDRRQFDDEIVLVDLATVEKRAERFRKERRAGPEVDANERVRAHLESGKPLRAMGLSDADRQALGPGIQLLSATPLITLYNLSEAAWADPAHAAWRETRVDETSATMAMCAALEKEIAALPREDQGEMLAGLGLGEPARDVFVRQAYRLLDLVSFLTCGPDECRAWPIRRGTSARKAAGKVHSDIERGFIRAEVYAFDDLRAAGGSEATVKQRGLLRLEGKDYVVRDGDVVNFRFAV